MYMMLANFRLLAIFQFLGGCLLPIARASGSEGFDYFDPNRQSSTNTATSTTSETAIASYNTTVINNATDIMNENGSITTPRAAVNATTLSSKRVYTTSTIKEVNYTMPRSRPSTPPRINTTIFSTSTVVETSTSSTTTGSTKPFITATAPNATCYAISYPLQDDPSGTTIYFRKTLAGVQSQAICPNNQKRIATWRCTVNGWSTDPGQPDLTDCVSSKVATLMDEVIAEVKGVTKYGISAGNRTTIINNAVLRFENITASKNERQAFLAGDFLKITSTASTLASAITDSGVISSDHAATAATKMLYANSNLMSTETRSAWSSLPKKDRGATLAKLLDATEKLSFATMASKEKKTIYGIGSEDVDQRNRTDLEPNRTLVTDSFDVNLIEVIRNAPLKFSVGSSSTRPETQMSPISIDFSAALLRRMKRQPTLASLVVYNSLSDDVERLRIGGVDGNNTVFNSPIFTMAFADENGQAMGRVLLPDYFQFAAEHRYSEAADYETICSYYDTEYSLWLQRGCTQVSKNATHTLCQCDHLTTFAILVDFTGRSRDRGVDKNTTQLPPAVERALFEISIIGCALSIAALFVFILLVAVVSRQNNTLRVIYCNFACCLLIAEVIFLAGADKVNTAGCVPVAVMLQFFFTATFMWSGSIAFYFVLVIYGREPLASREQRPRWPYFLFGCYFISASLIGATWITAAASGEAAYGNESYCWMNLPYTWFFISPIAFVLVFNFGVLAAISVKICTIRLSSNYVDQGNGETTAHVVCRAMVGIIWTMLVLCATWVLGFFYVSTDSGAVEFVFVVLNSFQGVLVLVFYIVTNRQIRLDFAMFCRRQACLPDCIHTWASYKVSSLSNDSWQYTNGLSRKPPAFRNQIREDYSRELSSLSNSH